MHSIQACVSWYRDHGQFAGVGAPGQGICGVTTNLGHDKSSFRPYFL
jgi:hypothetical protein